MKNIKLLLLFILSSAILMNGCATIFSSSTDAINFTSNPSGARILMDGLDIGKTPATLKIKRSGFGDQEITLKLDGYESRTFLLQKEFNLITIFNFANLIGWIIDIASGRVMKYYHKPYNLDLHPKAFNIDDLESDKFGRLIIPNEEESFFVYDESVGYKILFQ